VAAGSSEVSEESGVVAGDVEVKREDVEGLEDRVDGGLARSAPVGISEFDSDEEFGGGDGGDRDVGDGCGTRQPVRRCRSRGQPRLTRVAKRGRSRL